MTQNEIDNWGDDNLCSFALYSSFEKQEEAKTAEVEVDGEEEEVFDESEIGKP
jgi:hypothetical protein